MVFAYIVHLIITLIMKRNLLIPVIFILITTMAACTKNIDYPDPGGIYRAIILPYKPMDLLALPC